MPVDARRDRLVAAAIAGLLGALLVLIGACGGSDGARRPATAPAPFGHVHGLGVDPADKALYIATHTGLFRAADGAREPRRVGESRRDTMGFTVVSPNTFLASGHPDARDAAPQHLGLIVSDDAGRTWRELSLGGQADLHVIRVGRRLTYAFDAVSGSLFVSDDAASTWRAGQPPAALIDFAVDPENDRHLIGATADGVYRSYDRGSDWRRIRRAPPGLLAWQREDDRLLMLVAADGTVRVSEDSGRSWRRAGDVGAKPTATATHESAFYVATADGTVKVSRDRGRTWVVRTQSPEADRSPLR
jgi:photosystem II stability/assembly factor-like uncharacterized protein